MSCKVSYINNLNEQEIDFLVLNADDVNLTENALTSEAIKEELTQKHVDVANLLRKSGYVFPIKKNGITKFYAYSKQQKEFEDWLDVMNLENTVTFINDPEKNLDFININVLNGVVDIPQIDEEQERLESMYQIQKEFFVSDALLDFHSAIETLVDEQEHEQVLNDIIAGILDRIYGYENTLKTYTEDYQRVVNSKSINAIKTEIEKNGDKVKAISRYIVEANSQMKRFYKQYMGYTKDEVRYPGIRERLQVLNEMKTEYEQTKDSNLEADIKNEENALHDLLQQGRHVYHLFDFIEKINGELNNLGLKDLEAPIADYFPEALTENFTALANTLTGITADDLLKMKFQDNLTNAQIVEAISQLEPDFDYARSMELHEKLDKVLKESRRPKGSIVTILRDTLELRNTLNTTFDKLYTDVLYDTLYPKYTKVLEAVKKKEFSTLSQQELDLAVAGLEQDNLFLTPTQFRTLLGEAFRDTSFLSHQLSAPINVKDQFSKLIVGWIKQELHQVKRTNLQDLSALESHLKVLHWQDLDKATRDLYNDTMTYDTIEVMVSDYGKITQFSEAEMMASTDTQYIQFDNDLNQHVINQIENPAKTVFVKKFQFNNQVYYVRVQQEKDLIKEYDSFKYQNEVAVFQSQVDRVTEGIFRKLNFRNLYYYQSLQDANALNDFLADLESVNQEFGIDLKTKFLYKRYSLNFNDSILEVKANIFEAITPETMDYNALRNIIKNTLQADFYAARLVSKDTQEQELIMEQAGMFDNTGQMIDLNFDNLRNSRQQKFFKKNTGKSENKIWGRTTALNFALEKNLHDIFGTGYYTATETLTDENGREIQVDKQGKTIYVEDIEGNMIAVTAVVSTVGTQSVSALYKADGTPISSFEIAHFFRVKGKFVDFTSPYTLSGTGFNTQVRQQNQQIDNLGIRDYHTELKKQLDEANEIYSGKRIKGLPKVIKREGLSVYENVKRMLTDSSHRDAFMADLESQHKSGEYTFVEIDGKRVPVSKTKTGVDGVEIRQLANRFSNYVPVDSRENDLFSLITSYKSAANMYGMQIQALPTINSIRTKLMGDDDANIASRKAIKRTSSGQQVVSNKGNTVELVEAKRLTEMMLSFLDDIYYGLPQQEVIFNLGNIRINMDNVVNKIMNVSAYQALAFNFMAMAPNHFISTINNLSEGAMAVHFDKEIFAQTYAEIFGKRILDGTYFNDLRARYTQDKGLEAQAAIMFNAVQGEFKDKTGNIHNQSLTEKLSSDVLMFTQNSVEYTNQLLTMMSLMKGFKVSDGRTLFESIDPNWSRGQLLTFQPNVTEEDKNAFSALVQGINRRLHGNYAREDKNMLQKTYYGKLMMMFKRWIYDSVRNRWAAKDIDFETSTVEEGYFRTYIKMLLGEYTALFQEHGWAGMLKKEVLPKYMKGVATVWGKTVLAGVDSALFGVGSKSSASLKKFLYGESATEKQAKAIERAILEMGIFVQAGVLALVMHMLAEGLDDDENPTLKWMAQYVEFNAFKIQSDLGLYIPQFYTGGILGSQLPAGYTLDTALRFAKDPFTMTRFVDVNLGVFRDLFGFSYTEEGLNWKGNDVYERSGNGFEKGDYKIVTKLKKSVVAPYWQVMRLLNPEEQLQYLNMIFKN